MFLTWILKIYLFAGSWAWTTSWLCTWAGGCICLRTGGWGSESGQDRILKECIALHGSVACSRSTPPLDGFWSRVNVWRISLKWQANTLSDRAGYEFPLLNITQDIHEPACMKPTMCRTTWDESLQMLLHVRWFWSPTKWISWGLLHSAQSKHVLGFKTICKTVVVIQMIIIMSLSFSYNFTPNNPLHESSEAVDIHNVYHRPHQTSTTDNFRHGPSFRWEQQVQSQISVWRPLQSNTHIPLSRQS